MKLKDGRWRASGPEKYTFSEPDEALAIARFFEWQGQREVATVDIPTSHENIDAAAGAFVARVQTNEKTYLEIIVDKDDAPAKVSNWQPSASVWAWFRHQILTNRQHVANMTGVEQIAWLTDAKPPTESAKLAILIETYTSKPKLSPNEASRSKLFWKQFVKATGAQHVNEIGHAQVIEYERAILADGLAAKSIHHRFSKIRTVFAYGLKRGIDIAGCRQALDALAMLEVKDAHPMDPTPITPANFWAVHAEAMKADDTTFATMMLTALNCCAYGGEVATLKRSEVDLKAGTYVGRRPKTKISRVAMLWPEVIAGLKKVPVRDATDFIFNTSRRSYTSNAVVKVWRRYCEAAGLPDTITFGQIRDAAYSLACQHATLDQAKVLAGHAFGGASDFYVRRNPQFVADACNAIRTEFFKARKKK